MAWILAALAVLVACAAAGRRVLGSLPFALALGAIAIWLTRDTELLPGIWPNCVRAVCFSIPALLVLGLLVFPTRGGRLLDAYPAIAPIFIPGLLVASYTTNTQPLAYAASIAGAVFFTIRSRPLRSAGPTLVAVFLLGSSLWRAGTQRGNVFPAWLADAPATATSVALLAILAWSSWQMLRNRHDLIALAVALGAAIASLLLRDRAEPSAARVALTVLPLLCVLAALGGRKSLALHLGLAGYLWVSRSAELPGLLATLALAELVGLALARSKAELDRTELLLLTAFAFGLLFVQRVAIQGGLDWNSLDLRAGAFGDPVVPAWLVGTALTWKYLLAELLGLFALLMGVETELSERLGPALLLVYLGRTTALVGMLIFCGTSFWTGVRVTSDLPFAVLGLPLASLVWIAARSAESARRAERARSPLEEQAEAQTKNASIPAARTDQ